MWSLFSAFKAALSFIFTVLHHKWQIILAGYEQLIIPLLGP